MLIVVINGFVVGSIVIGPVNFFGWLVRILVFMGTRFLKFVFAFCVTWEIMEVAKYLVHLMSYKCQVFLSLGVLETSRRLFKYSLRRAFFHLRRLPIFTNLFVNFTTQV